MITGQRLHVYVCLFSFYITTTSGISSQSSMIINISIKHSMIKSKVSLKPSTYKWNYLSFKEGYKQKE